MTVHATPQTIGRVFKQLELERFSRANKAIVDAATIGARIVRTVVPVDTGRLRRETRLITSGDLAARGGKRTLATIVEETPYAAAQEVGTRPFKVPLRVLFDWAYRQAPNLGLNRNDEGSIWRFARGAQKAIATKGIKAKFHTRDALPKLRYILHALMLKALGVQPGSRAA